MYSSDMYGLWFGKPSTEQDSCKKGLVSQNLKSIGNASFKNRKELNTYLINQQVSLPDTHDW